MSVVVEVACGLLAGWHLAGAHIYYMRGEDLKTISSGVLAISFLLMMGLQ